MSEWLKDNEQKSMRKEIDKIWELLERQENASKGYFIISLFWTGITLTAAIAAFFVALWR